MKKFFNKKAVMVLAVAMVMAMSALPAFAAEGDTVVDGYATVQTALTTGFTTMADKLLAMLAIMIPTAVSVVGVYVLAKKAIVWIKSLIK